jgi:SAM-dependent methyltransferase
MRALLTPVAERVGEVVGGSPKNRRRFYRFSVQTLEKSNETYHDEWKLIDPLYCLLRDRLFAMPQWRFGPQYAYECAKWVFDRVKDLADIRDAVFCDLGCGRHSPYGIAAVFYLNGARRCIATDIEDPDDPARAARALYELLIDCLTNPDKWRWSGIGRMDFLDRIYAFDLEALRAGELAKGLANVDVEYVQADFCETSIEEDSVDVMASRSVLEHIPDLDAAARNMFKLLKPGGVAFHFVDMADHGIYGPGANRDYWTFLESADWRGHTNRLRVHEVEAGLAGAGLSVSRVHTQSVPMPADLQERLSEPWRDMPDDVLEVIRAGFAVRKPNAASAERQVSVKTSVPVIAAVAGLRSGLGR